MMTAVEPQQGWTLLAVNPPSCCLRHGPSPSSSLRPLLHPRTGTLFASPADFAQVHHRLGGPLADSAPRVAVTAWVRTAPVTSRRNQRSLRDNHGPNLSPRRTPFPSLLRSRVPHGVSKENLLFPACLHQVLPHLYSSAIYPIRVFDLSDFSSSPVGPQEPPAPCSPPQNIP